MQTRSQAIATKTSAQAKVNKSRWRSRKPPLPALSSRPEVVVVGDTSIAKKLERTIRETGVPTRRTETFSQTGSVTGFTRAVFFVPPASGSSVFADAKECSRSYPAIPMFAIPAESGAVRTIKRLYRAGVEAVFDWPADKHAISRTVLRLAAPLPSTRKKRKAASDVALEEIVRGRLRINGTDFGNRLIAQVSNSYAMLSGEVDALYKVNLAEKIAGEVPGVLDVVPEGVRVAGPRLSDRTVAAAVRQVLKHAGQVDSSTLALRVKNGHVTLSGIAEDRAELGRVEELIRHVRGVTGLTRFVTLSPGDKRRDHSVAVSVREALMILDPRIKFNVAVFDGVVVLRGTVLSIAERARAVHTALQPRGVVRVVDHLRVRKPRTLH